MKFKIDRDEVVKRIPISHKLLGTVLLDLLQLAYITSVILVAREMDNSFFLVLAIGYIGLVIMQYFVAKIGSIIETELMARALEKYLIETEQLSDKKERHNNGKK